jgi:hypothetical protein
MIERVTVQTGASMKLCILTPNDSASSNLNQLMISSNLFNAYQLFQTCSSPCLIHCTTICHTLHAFHSGIRADLPSVIWRRYWKFGSIEKLGLAWADLWIMARFSAKWAWKRPTNNVRIDPFGRDFLVCRRIWLFSWKITKWICSRNVFRYFIDDKHQWLANPELRSRTISKWPIRWFPACSGIFEAITSIFRLKTGSSILATRRRGLIPPPPRY